MHVTTGPEVDHFYLRLVMQFYQNVLLKSTAHSSQLQPVVTGTALTQQPDEALQIHSVEATSFVAVTIKCFGQAGTSLDGGLVLVGSRPSDHYFRSVCWFVCLFVQSFSQPSLIRFR